MKQEEFSRRRAAQHDDTAGTSRKTRAQFGDIVRGLHPAKIASGAAFILLGFFLVRTAIPGYLPKPEFYRVVIEHPAPNSGIEERFVDPKAWLAP